MDTLVKHLVSLNGHGQYWSNQELLLLAVSGGADSMALLDAMNRLPESQKPRLRVIHVHHHLRPEADEEARFVESACRTRGIAFVQRDWPQELHPSSGWEAAAREARYRFFQEELAVSGASGLVTGHHGDDQMETILMRLTRGSTIEGMAGIKTARAFGPGQLFRPFLGVAKDDLYAYCHRNGVAYHEDVSNRDSRYARNRYRKQVLPFLKEENPQAVQHFQQFSEDLLALWEVASVQLETAVSRCFYQEENTWVGSVSCLAELPRDVRRLVLGYFLRHVWEVGEGAVQRSHVEDIMGLMDGSQPQASLHLPGGRRVRRKYNQLFFLLEQERRSSEEHSFLAKLNLNQWLELPFNGKMGLFSYHVGKDVLAGMRDGEAILLKEGTRIPLTVRHPQPGDRIRMNPAAPFTKKLARLFIDRKVPHERRRQAYVVQEESGEIVWVPTYAQSLQALSATQENEGNISTQSGYIVIYKKDDEVKR